MPRKPKPAPVRDRIRELRRVRARDLVPHPKNWRTHPGRQREVLEGLLAEIGYADALLARERPDGRLQLIDGHLRAETTPDAEVPVLVLDLNDTEADQLLATLDPLAALAGTDARRVETLLEGLRFQHAAVTELVQEISRQPPPVMRDPVPALADNGPGATDSPPPRRGTRTAGGVHEATPGARYCVLIDCDDEATQLQLLDQFTREGRKCRALIA